MRVGGIAPQSITSKASARRGEASWRERAASSLPVPDSPPRSTGTVVGAARSSVAYTSRIGRDAPTRRPKAPRSLSGTSTAPSPGTTRMRVRPSSKSTSPRSVASRICSAPERVPLRLPRSRTVTPSSVASTSMWYRLT
jgi:hypothetical protein